MNEKEVFKIGNETQADFIRTIRAYLKATKEVFTQNTNAIVPNYIRSPDGTQYQLSVLLKELERYEKEKEERKNENKSNKVKKTEQKPK